MQCIRKLRGALKVVFLCLFLNSLSFASNLIEPTRTLSHTDLKMGNLSVFSEPVGLEVELDGQKIGQTPVFHQKVAPGMHVLLVKGIKREIYVAPAQDLRLSLYKGSFVKIPAEKKQVLRQPKIDKVKPPHKPQAEQPARKEIELHPLYWPLNPRGQIF